VTTPSRRSPSAAPASATRTSSHPAPRSTGCSRPTRRSPGSSPTPSTAAGSSGGRAPPSRRPSCPASRPTC
jgi:hypothetical protein